MTVTSNKEKMMLIVLANIAVLALFYLLAFKSLVSASTNNMTEIQQAEVQLEADIAEVSNQEMYTRQIQELRIARRQLYARCFPSATTERVHAYLADQLEEANLDMRSIQIESAVQFFAEEAQEAAEAAEEGDEAAPAVQSAIFNNNFATISLVGTYDNIMKFIKAFEDRGRTHQFEIVNMVPVPEGFRCTIKLNLFTVIKDEADDTFYLLPFQEIFIPANIPDQKLSFPENSLQATATVRNTNTTDTEEEEQAQPPTE